MKLSPSIELDARDVDQLLAELLTRRPGYWQEWQPGTRGTDVALLQITARYLHGLGQRLNQAPDKNKLAFLDLLGLGLITAQSARAPIVFQLSAQAADTRVPAGARVAAPPAPETGRPIIFETERAVGLAAAKLKQVVSLWPGRDQYIDHSAAYLAGQALNPFKKFDLEDTPHILYLAHDTLLALAGNARLEVGFELTQPSTETLDVVWEYWDGQVWRSFKAMRPSCDESEARKIDSTVGLTRTGRYRMEADCAETVPITINGIKAFWIRGRLNEPLPPYPGNLLPEVDALTISSEIARPLTVSLTAGTEQPVKLDQDATLIVKIADEAGAPLSGVTVELSEGANKMSQQSDAAGEYRHKAAVANGTVTVRLNEFQATKTVTTTTGITKIEPFKLQVSGLAPDQAFVDSNQADTTKPFFPLGQQPQPGSAFYFTAAEIFTKPGARLRIYVQPTGTAQGQMDMTGATPLPHTVSWEYWNGREWLSLLSYTGGNANIPLAPADFSGAGFIEFDIPNDMGLTKVNDQEAQWMRVRLISGSFGFKQTVTWGPSNENKFTYVVPQPPAIAKFCLGYTWQHGPFHAEHVLTYNDFQYADRTEEAKWPGRTFQPYTLVGDATPALYLGFDKPLPVDRLNFYFDIDEQRGETEGPAVVWEYWNGGSWRELSIEDETHQLRMAGMVSFIGAEDSQALARFDTALHWVRARLKEDGPPGEPLVTGIFTNAVWATQRQTLTGEQLGISSGLPNQLLTFRQYPVLSGEQIEVRESSGARANVEWRILALEVLQGDERAFSLLEEQLEREGPQAEIQYRDLRLKLDRNHRVAEVWVRWQSQLHLLRSGPNDRHYVLERARGRLFFGDGERGKIPPLSAVIQAATYRTGGGLFGNVAARTITQLQAGVGGVDAVFNPRPAEGGAETETLDAFNLRGPQTIRHRNRALLPQDYETMAREASPAVAFARAIPARDPNGRAAPGWVTLLILPESDERRPWPSFGLREQVQRYLEARASADLAAAGHIHVTGPDFQPIDVQATFTVLDPTEAGTVEKSARAALERFFHPLRGGPEHRGWALGRDVYLSDVASVLERVDGIDYVQELALLLEGGLQGERVKVAAQRIVVAGEIRLKVM